MKQDFPKDSKLNCLSVTIKLVVLLIQSAGIRLFLKQLKSNNWQKIWETRISSFTLYFKVL
jgi:hypothetical protein